METGDKETKELVHDDMQSAPACSDQPQNRSPSSAVAADATCTCDFDEDHHQGNAPSVSPSLDSVSGFAFGSLLSYVKEFGTPHQSSRADSILKYFLELEKNQPMSPKQRTTRRRRCANANEAGAEEIADKSDILEDVGEKIKGLATSDGADWLSLRQLLYEISGDWLWHHACHNFRTNVAPQMANIPETLREEALRVKKPIELNNDVILNDENAQKRGYVPFTGYIFPGSDAFFEDAA